MSATTATLTRNPPYLFRVAHGLKLGVVAGEGHPDGAAPGRRVGLATLARAERAVLERVLLAGARALALNALKKYSNREFRV